MVSVLRDVIIFPITAGGIFHKFQQLIKKTVVHDFTDSQIWRNVFFLCVDLWPALSIQDNSPYNNNGEVHAGKKLLI